MRIAQSGDRDPVRLFAWLVHWTFAARHPPDFSPESCVGSPWAAGAARE
jgi:hypothetical protein